MISINSSLTNQQSLAVLIVDRSIRTGYLHFNESGRGGIDWALRPYPAHQLLGSGHYASQTGLLPAGVKWRRWDGKCGAAVALGDSIGPAQEGPGGQRGSRRGPK